MNKKQRLKKMLEKFDDFPMHLLGNNYSEVDNKMSHYILMNRHYFTAPMVVSDYKIDEDEYLIICFYNGIVSRIESWDKEEYEGQRIGNL